MHNGLTHWSQVGTKRGLIGLGMFGEVDSADTGSRLIEACTQLAVCLGDRTVTPTKSPLHKYHLASG